MMTALILLSGLTCTTAAAETDCPEGFECVTPEPTHCLSEQALEERQQAVTDCQETNDKLRGRIESLRDQIAPLQVRVEELVAEKTKMRIERDQAREKLDSRASPWSWLSYGVCGGAGGAGVVQLATADGAGDLWRGGGTAAFGLAACVVGRLLR